MSDNPFDCDLLLNSGVWYKFSVAFPAAVVVSTCNQADFNTQIALYSGACDSVACEAGADDTTGCGKTTRVVHDIQPQEIYIVVNGYRSAAGNFSLTVSATALVIAPPVPPVSWW